MAWNKRRKEYKKYMRSAEWEKKRREYFDSKYFSGYCGHCRADMPPYDVHHLSYKNFMNEDIATDLIALCKSCHWKQHNPNKSEVVRKEKKVKKKKVNKLIDPEKSHLKRMINRFKAREHKKCGHGVVGKFCTKCRYHKNQFFSFRGAIC